MTTQHISVQALPGQPLRRGAWLRLAARLALFVTLALTAHSALAQVGGFDRESLAAFVRTQGGADAPRGYAYAGTVYDVPSGKVLATVDGWQLARVFPGGAADPGAWYVVRRAFLLYRAVGSGEILAYYPDVRAASTPVPTLSIVRYALEGDRVVSRAFSGRRGNAREATLPEQLGAAREDDSWVFRRVLSPPDPQQKPIELMEIVLHEPGGRAPPRIRSVMTKVADNWGFLPPGGRHLLHLAWRPAGEAALAPVVRELVTQQAPPALRSLPPTLQAAWDELGMDAAQARTAAATSAPATH